MPCTQSRHSVPEASKKTNKKTEHFWPSNIFVCRYCVYFFEGLVPFSVNGRTMCSTKTLYHTWTHSAKIESLLLFYFQVWFVHCPHLFSATGEFKWASHAWNKVLYPQFWKGAKNFVQPNFRVLHEIISILNFFFFYCLI